MEKPLKIDNDNNYRTNNDFVKKTLRDSNFELLRIIAMFIIILSHISQHGLWFAPETTPSFNYLLSRFRLGWLGNLLFILISGYFMARTKFSWKKVFNMWLQVFTISVTIGLVTYFSKISISSYYDSELYAQKGFFLSAHPAGLKELLRSFLPCYFSNNWFVTAYMVFYLFAPFCNKLFTALSERQHRLLLFLMVLVGTVIPCFPKQGAFFSDRLFIFIMCHCIADYIYRYNPQVLNRTKVNIGIVVFLITFFYGWIVFSHYVLFPSIPILKNHINTVETYFGKMDSPFGILCAVLIFSIFKNLSIRNIRFINLVASATFGVYLLHENHLIKKWLWHVVFKMDNWVSSPFLLPYMLFCALIVYIICTVIELIRSNLFTIIGKSIKKTYI